MNEYEQRQEDKRARLEAAAQRRRTDSEAAFDGARQATAGIPFGQPILVDHYSAPRHRAALKRSDQRMRKGIELSKEAAELEHRAAAVGTGGVSSDDPDAPDKLRDKLATMTARRDRMKQVNAEFRRGEGWPQRLTPGLTPEEQDEITRNMTFGHSTRPFPGYSLTNLGARIRDTAQRIEQLSAQATARATLPPQSTTEVAGVTITHDRDENRVRLTFPRRLTAEEFRHVRRMGFVYSRTNKAFQRKLNAGGVCAAESLVAWFDQQPFPPITQVGRPGSPVTVQGAMTDARTE